MSEEPVEHFLCGNLQAGGIVQTPDVEGVHENPHWLPYHAEHKPENYIAEERIVEALIDTFDRGEGRK